MKKQVKEFLDNKTENYILPLFWQNEASHNRLLKEMKSIQNCGIKEICLESRTYHHFAEEQWFNDFSYILQEAKRMDMRVWLLDDKHYPTGFANGKIAEHPDLRQWFLIERHLDVTGPCSGSVLLSTIDENPQKYDRNIVAALAVKRTKRDEVLTETVIDLTESISGNLLHLELPKGCYRIFIIFMSHEGALRENYLDVLNTESVDLLIKEVYEPHYERFKDYFGNTFAGFFSDEPSFSSGMWNNFYEVPNYFNYKPGTPYIAIPWHKSFVTELKNRLGYDVIPYLPALWYDMDDKTQEIRYAYMDLATETYRNNFNRKIGDWCHTHNVEYIGHIIEDENCHSHLGPGAGHYFRALDSQDMSGIDVVFYQIIPGLSDFTHNCAGFSGRADSQFYDYVLAKLASSMAHLKPEMKGRSVCEMFGAFGWAEGVPLMKRLTDHMLVRGINHFVPHAFSTGYPNPDCPPHFYADGHYNQYEAFAELMRYANRMCHLFSNGTHIASAAILYDADIEWCSRNYMKMQIPAQLLYDSHIDYDIVPMDYIINDASVQDSKIIINNEKYPCLIIPECDGIPYVLMEKLINLSKQGAHILFLNKLPLNTIDSIKRPYIPDETFSVIAIEELVNYIYEHDFYDINVLGSSKFLRHYHYISGNSDCYMFFNESSEKCDVRICTHNTGKYFVVNLLNNEKNVLMTENGIIHISLCEYESIVVIFDPEIEEVPDNTHHVLSSVMEINNKFKITGYTCAFDNLTEVFSLYEELSDITANEKYAEFSGIIQYETSFILPKADSYKLDLGIVGETAEIWINEQKVGFRISAPYTIDITRFIKPGANNLIVKVANSMAYHEKDRYSRGLLLPPSGLIGPVKIFCFQNQKFQKATK